jgi:hypothetical protein
MAELIVYYEGAYNIYGTIADGCHYEGALTLDQLREVIKEQHGSMGLADLPQRLARAHEKGCSGLRYDLADCIAQNRQGPNESPLTSEEFIQRFLTLPPAAATQGDKP